MLKRSESAELREQRLAGAVETIAHAEALRDNPVLSKALEMMESEAVGKLQSVDVTDQFAMVEAVIGWRKSCAIRQVIVDLCDSREQVEAEIEQLNKESE